MNSKDMNSKDKSSRSEYDCSVWRAIPASVAAFGLLMFSAVCVPSGYAQGVPASVTSQGFGGRAINGTAPSVTSLPPSGFSSHSQVTFSGSGFGPGTGAGKGKGEDNGHHHHHSQGEFLGPAWYPVGVPYAVDLGPEDATDDNAQADDDADYQGGPTVFDRRGAGADSYVPPVKDVPKPHSMAQAYTAPVDDPPQPETVLVFKDGHEMEVGNYAILGETLFDLTPGHARKIALADLDLDGTRRLNEDHGVIFELPSSQAN